VASMARLLLVSEAQIRSLEEGGSRGFYNAQHRRTVALRYAAALGMDGQTDESFQQRYGLVRGAAPEVSGHRTASAGLPLKAGQDVHCGPNDLGASPRRSGLDYWLAAGALGGLAVWFSVDAWQNYRRDPVADPLLAVQQRIDESPAPLHLARQADIKGYRNGSVPDRPGAGEIAPGASKLRDNTGPRPDPTSAPLVRPEMQSAPPSIVQSPQPFPQPFSRSTATGSEGSLLDADARALAPQTAHEPQSGRFAAGPPDRRYSPLPSAGLAANAAVSAAGNAATSPAAEGRSASEERGVDLCEVSDRHAATAVPVSRLKSTPYVHISSGVSQRICIRTADGRIERLQLSANEARSVFGRAPFTVVSEQPSSIDIFYLGARVRHNGESRVLKVVDPDPMS